MPWRLLKRFVCTLAAIEPTIRRIGVLATILLSAFGDSPHAAVIVTTYHNDNARTGQFTQETVLTPANVNSGQFGKLFTIAVDGWVYAQPLYLSNLSIGGSTHNVLYVATDHDTLYALDADSGSIYWHFSLIPANGSTVNSSTDLNCGDLVPEVGITGTPAIDATTGTIYVVAKSKVGGNFYQYLHAIDVSTAAEKFGGPVNIQATVPGTASDGNGTTVSFNPRDENQRSALLLENGHVVIGWSSHCDHSPWHGWIISYSASTLAQEAAYNTSPNGYGNGVWMSGGGSAADASGNIYFATGNGSWNGTTDLGDSLVKLGSPSGGAFPLVDYFTPYNQGSLATTDQDVASGGLVLLPPLPSGQQLLTQMAKEGKIYLVDRNNMGKYCINQHPACTNNDPQIVQEVRNATVGVWGSPAYWNGYVYWGGANDDTGVQDTLKAFSFNANNSGLLSATPSSESTNTFGYSAPVPSISANGTTAGILWGLDDSTFGSVCSGGLHCQVLYAYDATNLATLLYNSSQAANSRDVPGSAVKFATPIIANGKVYFGSQYAVSGFGLLATFTVSPTSLPFGNVPRGTTSGAQPVAVKNTGTAALPITSITLSGPNPLQFSQTNTCGTSVAPSATCTISVVFKPAGTGLKKATLDVNAGGAGGTRTVALTGTGTSGVATFTVSPTSLTFGSVPHGTTSAAQPVAVKNTGTAALPITSITLSGPNPKQFAQTNTCGTSVAAGATCTISVVFKPAATGAKTATLNVNAGSGAGTGTVALAGTGT